VDKKDSTHENSPGQISRRELEVVIRRAAELYAAESDPDDGISESELIRIASELGLPSHLVRQALYETTGYEAEPTLVDRLAGPTRLTLTRVIPSEPEPIAKRLEEYLTSQEYLQITRREGRRTWFAPADDVVSRIIRALARPSKHYAIARARRLALTVNPLDEKRTHVRIDLDLGAQRRDLLLVGGLLGAGPVGLLLGGVAAAMIDILAGPIGATGVIGMIGAGMITAAGAGTSVGAGIFRQQRRSAELEVAGILDRIESGEPLEPPIPPWRKRLQRRLFR